jgi:hypothetical protein
MTLNPFMLLNALGGVANIVSGRRGAPGGLTRADLDRPDFEALLGRAREGGIQSGRKVALGADADGLELTTEQLDRLTVAADRAEANGVRHAVVLIDGMALRLDVESRLVTGVVDQQSEQLHAGVDAILTAPAPTPEPLPLPAGRVANPSVLALLAGR